MLGLHAVDGVESTALSDVQGNSLAFRFHWQLDSRPDAIHAAAPEAVHVASINVGQVSATYVPGLASGLLDFFSGVLPQRSSNPGLGPSSMGSERSVHTGEVAHKGSCAASGSARPPPPWLTGGAVVGCSVLSLQLAAVSEAAAAASAAVLCIRRCSVHLGSFKPAARAGSVTAELFAMQKPPVAGPGLRIAATGVQIGLSECWKPARSRRGWGAEELEASGVAWVSSPIEAQALVRAAEVQMHQPQGPSEHSTESPSPFTAAFQQPPSQSAGDLSHLSSGRATQQSCALALAVSPVQLWLTGGSLVALRAVVDGALAEFSRGFRGPFPKPGMPTSSTSKALADDAAWLAELRADLSSIHFICSPAGVGSFAAAMSAMPAGQPSRGWLEVSSVTLAVAAGANLEHSCRAGGAEGTVTVLPALLLRALQPVVLLGPGMQLQLPAADVSIGGLPDARGAHAAADTSRHGAEPPNSYKPHGLSSSACQPCGPPVAVIKDIRLQKGRGGVQLGDQSQSMTPESEGAVQLAVQDISFGASMQQLTMLVSLLSTVLQNRFYHCISI